LWAAPFEQKDEMGGQPWPARKPSFAQRWPDDTKLARLAAPGANTTIGVVATDAALTPSQAKRIAIMAHDGLARALRPVHSALDGDTLFAIATGTQALSEPEPVSLSRLGLHAADCVTRAVGRAIYEAQSLPGMPSYREHWAAARKPRTR
jgi:L-aminopeptidase/D-esterase-like protein